MSFREVIKDNHIFLVPSTSSSLNFNEVMEYLRNNTYITKLGLAGLICNKDVKELAQLQGLTSLILDCEFDDECTAIAELALLHLVQIATAVSISRKQQHWLNLKTSLVLV